MEIVNWSVRPVAHTPEPEHLIELLGRVCYQSQQRATPCPYCKNERSLSSNAQAVIVPCISCVGTGVDIASARDFVRMLIKRGHESVLEHASASFDIVTDRGVTHEIVRHRIASYSQESTRFCNYIKETFGSAIRVIEPPWLNCTAASPVWRTQMESAERAYFALLQLGEPPELARSVLPTCLKTEIGMTANFREWRHFIRLRESPKAHPQMRPVAGAIHQALLAVAPSCFEDL